MRAYLGKFELVGDGFGWVRIGRRLGLGRRWVDGKNGIKVDEMVVEEEAPKCAILRGKTRYYIGTYGRTSSQPCMRHFSSPQWVAMLASFMNL